jgi:hypothetical protein
MLFTPAWKCSPWAAISITSGKKCSECESYFMLTNRYRQLYSRLGSFTTFNPTFYGHAAQGRPRADELHPHPWPLGRDAEPQKRLPLDLASGCLYLPRQDSERRADTRIEFHSADKLGGAHALGRQAQK